MFLLLGNFLIGSVVRVTFASLTTEEDAQSIVDFFADKDTGLYDQSYLQVCTTPLQWRCASLM